MTETNTPKDINIIEGHAKEKLDSLRAPEGHGIFASRGTSFEYAVFGRDSIEAAEDLLTVDPALSKDVLLTMARLQGNEVNNITEEEIGRIHHEYRIRRLGDFAITKSSAAVLERLSPKWGGTKDKLLYYGSIDATPLFVRLSGNYIKKYGSGILNENIKDDSGNESLFS